MKKKISDCLNACILIVFAYGPAIVYLLMIVFSITSEFIDYSEINLNPNDWCNITDVDYRAVVSDKLDGKVTITEKLTFDVHAASKNNGYWELWRALPESYVDGVKVNYRVLSVKQIFPDGHTLEYQNSNKLYTSMKDYKGETYYNTSTFAYDVKNGPYKWYHSGGPYNPSMGNYECVLFYIDDVYRDQLQFEVTYEMSNASLKYGDCSELYLSMYSEKTIKKLNSFHGEILVPNDIMPQEGNYLVHTYGTNSNVFKYTEDNNLHPGYHTFAFSLSKYQLKFSPYNQYIEFVLVSSGEDKHIFTENAIHNDYTDENVLKDILKEMKRYDRRPLIFFVIKLALFIGAIYVSYDIYLKAKGNDEKVRTTNTFYKPEFDFEYFREIPSDLDPVFASHLVFCKDKEQKEIEDEYGAIILSLVRKKYIRIEKIIPTKDWSEKNTKIVILYDPTTPVAIAKMDTLIASEVDDHEPLFKSEKYFFNLIARYAVLNEVTMSKLQEKISSDYVNTETFLQNIKSIPRDIGPGRFFQSSYYTRVRDNEKKEALKKGVWGILLMTIGNFLLHFTRIDYAFGSLFMIGATLIWSWRYLRKQCDNYLLLTQMGEDEYAKWHGLYKFLNNETLLNEAPIESLGLWEKYLIYATAFGIPEKVIKVLKVKVPEVNLNNSPVLGNYYYRSPGFRTYSRSYHSSVRSASAHYHSSSYGGYGSYSYGGHGGYGGGGRGGGGGGGGH